MKNSNQTSHLENLHQTVKFAIEEDLGDADISAQLININTQARAEVICRDNAIICGQDWVNEVFNQIDPNVSLTWLANDGDGISPNQVLFQAEGTARSLLTAERSALNFLQSLSGTATVTRHYVDLIEHTQVKLLDTRKTIPGLRRAQKYAVTCGGGKNHRMGLYDAFLIKENHILACGSITHAISQAKSLYPGRRVEVEVENLEEYEEAIRATPNWIMLDNFSANDLKTAVATERGEIQLEASGGIENEKDLVRIAETGVDYISMGVLTKNNIAVDLSMRFLD